MLFGEFDFSNNYNTGGEAINVRNYFSKPLITIHFFPKDGYVFEYDEVNKKVKAFKGGIEVENGTDLSNLSKVKFMAIGWA